MQSTATAPAPATMMQSTATAPAPTMMQSTVTAPACNAGELTACNTAKTQLQQQVSALQGDVDRLKREAALREHLARGVAWLSMVVRMKGTRGFILGTDRGPLALDKSGTCRTSTSTDFGGMACRFMPIKGSQTTVAIVVTCDNGVCDVRKPRLLTIGDGVLKAGEEVSIPDVTNDLPNTTQDQYRWWVGIDTAASNTVVLFPAGSQQQLPTQYIAVPAQGSDVLPVTTVVVKSDGNSLDLGPQLTFALI